MMLIPIKQIKLRTYNRDDKDDITGLAASIQEHGLINPILVTELEHNQYRLIAGERRLRATQHNGGKEIYCSVIEADELQQQKLNLAENLQRKDLTIWEEAKHVQELKALQPEARVEDLAIQIGRSAPWVAHRLQLAKLHPDLLKIFQQQNWPISHIARLARYGHDFQGQIAKGIREKQKEQWNTDWVYVAEGKRSGTYPPMSDLKRFIDQFEVLLKSAMWKLEDAELLPKAGACTTCPKRSSQQGLLFQEPGDNEADTCLDPECFQQKKVEFVKLSVDKLKKESKQKPLYFGDTYAAAVPGLPKADSQSWNFSQVKKTTAGAVPAIYVNGSDLGKTVWVVKERGYQTERQTSRRQISQETGKPEPPSTKERLATILHKRQAFAIRKWMGLLESRKPSLEQVLPIVTMLGTSSNSRFNDAREWKEIEQLRSEPDGIAAKLWESCCEVLEDRCRITGPVEKQAADRWIEAVHQAEALNEYSSLLNCFQEAITEIKLTRALITEGVEDPGLSSVESKPKKGKGGK